MSGREPGFDPHASLLCLTRSSAVVVPEEVIIKKHAFSVVVTATFNEEIYTFGHHIGYWLTVQLTPSATGGQWTLPASGGL